jgi:hypothetical protein
MSRQRVFTPATVETIRELAAQGKTASEIAAAIGSTVGSVRVRCSDFKIKLKRSRRPGLQRTRQRQTREPHLVVHMRAAAYAALKRKAAHMEKSADELARVLLEEIVSSDLYEAVLDVGK